MNKNQLQPRRNRQKQQRSKMRQFTLSSGTYTEERGGEGTLRAKKL